MSEQRPQSFTVDYNGTPLEFTRLPDKNGYYFMCPGTDRHPSRGQVWIDTDSGTKHTLTFDEQGRATIRNSIGCVYNCGFHVWVTDGVARDA
jgi:hypothetical protein